MNLSIETAQTQRTEGASGEVRKFLFDLAFDSTDGRAEENEKERPLYTQEQLDAAKTESYEAGLSAGKKAAQDEKERQDTALWAAIETRLGSVVADSRAQWDRQLDKVQNLICVVMRKIFPVMASRGGLEEIEAVVRRAIAEMASEPRLVIRVTEALFDEAKKRVDAISEKQAYAGKIVLLGDASLGPSDCRIEWADGGVERDTARLWAEIESVLSPSLAVPDEQESPVTGSVEPPPEAGEKT